MRFPVGAILAALVATSTAATSTAAAEPGTDWQPAGKWEVNFAAQQCLAFRPYKRGNETVQIALEAIPPGEGLTFYLIVPPETLDRWTNASVQVGGRRIEAGSLSEFSMGDKKLRATSSVFDEEEAARLEAGEPLGIGPDGRLMHMSLAALPTVRKHLASCVSDLLKSWGYPIDRQQTIATYPEAEGGSLPRFFRPNDYPASAIREDIDGRVRVLFDVRTDGRARNCRVILSSRNKELDNKTCQVIVERARFVPAKDVSGQPIDAPSLATIIWVIPG